MKKLDIHPVNLVIIFLGVWGTIGIIGVLRLIEMKIDPASIAIVTTLVGPIIGSMGSILVNAMKPSQETVQATIANTKNNPIPIDDGDSKSESS